MTQSPPEDPLSLGQKLVAVLEGGRRTSTYKLATILALLDLAVESVPEHPDDAVDIDLDALSERVLAMYWRQIRPIEGVQIRQSSDGRSAILAIVETLRTSTGIRERVGSPAGAEAADPNGYREAVEAIKVTLVRYPLQLLQRVNNAEYECFLYNDSWMNTTSLRIIENDHGNAIRLLPGVANALARLAPLLRPAFQLAWITDVRRMNAWLQEDGPDLAAHLFGSDRISLTRVRDVLREGFGSRCFYCDRTISDVPQVDHVLPWSRVPIDGLANLVLACRRCNGDKSDLLPIPDHHHRAMARGQATLDELASSINWPSQYRRAESAARGIYATTPAGTPMWCAAKNVRLSSRADFAW
ncbi:HNH endonuclease [Williamsia phyllosphaerae]|uniref:HNH endonuclease n=1 Tax=Williamsia phyllosphaerae TaxID=885042 RepID=A0ABQ1V510_9NOCA|nr:HNH endonuclease domain-containing protein [Williamsia phyllosphaerae]GGF35540.1 HNH endonuclease [Williamsia phyllosphaerae]